jgi:hypothetical protein
MEQPYIFVSDHAPHFAELWGSAGIETVEERGYHAIFAATVPFIPSFLSSDFIRSLGGGMGRIKQIVLRQFRFINDLANARELAEGGVAFDLRFIAHPARTPTERATIEIAFLGKVFHPNRRRAAFLGLQLWRKFLSHYPLEDPFNYPLQPVNETDFGRYLMPIPIEQIKPENLLEIRKYEDRDPMLGESVVAGYFPHPFEPVLDFSAMARFLETLSMQQQPCVVSICIQPTQLLTEELRVLNQILVTYERLTQEAQQEQGWLSLYRRERLEILRKTFEPLINQRSHLFMIKVQVIGAQLPPADLLEALGSEFMNNITPEPRQWARQIVSNARDLEIALRNFHFLEHQLWGDSGVDSTVRRLRFLVSGYEAAGAFRLPIPPESGYMPGLTVKDEPFVMPTEVSLPTEPSVALGEIIHRGRPTGIPFYISIRELTRHALIGGSTGSGKTNTCLHLLSHLWAENGIPFLVLYPIDKPDYRLLMADRKVRDHLLLFTVGDENTAPFRFNPFAVPSGILLKTHISQLMRCFSAAFSMWDPLPAIYRAAMRQVYSSAGWDLVSGRGGDEDVRTPTMSQFYDAIVQCAETLTADYGREVRGNVKQGAEIRVRDLLDNMGHVVNASEPAPFNEILKRPTVMELGRVGSTEDTALIMGFMMMLISEELQSRSKQNDPAVREKNIHLTLVEEAHRLMSRGYTSNEHTADPRTKGGEDFSNLLAEVRGFGEGVLIAEQIPTNLVQGAIGNTYLKVMHWLEDANSFGLFCEIMNLNERQRDYARTLERGHVIVRGQNGYPVHVKVNNYLDLFQDSRDRPNIDDSDGAVRNFMHDRIQIPLAQPWIAPSILANSGSNTTNNNHQHGDECRLNPKTCSYYPRVRQISAELRSSDIQAVVAATNDQDWRLVRHICSKRTADEGLGHDILVGYCYLYYLTQNLVGRTSQTVSDRFPSIRSALAHFFDEDTIQEV